MMKYALQTTLLALLLTTLTYTAQAELNLELPETRIPDLGSPANAVLSQTEESLLGISLLRELRATKPIIEDPELSEWLRALGNRLSRHAPGGGNYYFLIVKNPQINAYAMPGGVIVLHSGLILNSRSESELASVIAHEIAHVSQRHIARMMANQQNNPLLTGLGVLAGAAAARNSPEAAEAIITGTIATQAHQQLSFSQKMESEADRVGLRILAAAQFNTQAFPLFLEKLESQNSEMHGDITKYLRTHPLTIDRISDSRSQARRTGKGKVNEDIDYLYAREKLRALVAPNSTPITQGHAQLKLYSQAITQLRKSNGKAALQQLGNNTQPLAVALAKAKSLNLLGRYNETERLLQPLANAYPGQESILLPLASALLANNKAQQAWQLLKKKQLSEQSSLEFLELRQRVAEQAKQSAEAYLSAAERSIRMGAYKRAKAIVEQASRLPTTAAHTSARLQAISREISQMEARERRITQNLN